MSVIVSKGQTRGYCVACERSTRQVRSIELGEGDGITLIVTLCRACRATLCNAIDDTEDRDAKKTSGTNRRSRVSAVGNGARHIPDQTEPARTPGHAGSRVLDFRRKAGADRNEASGLAANAATASNTDPAI